MLSLPPALYTQIRQALLACDEITDPIQLRAILRVSALRPFADSIKIASNLNTQVDYLIGDFVDRNLTTGENALILLLELLANRYDTSDERHNRLLNLVTIALEAKTGTLPSVTVNRKSTGQSEALRQLREVLSNLYPDPISVRRLIDDAGLPTSAMPLSGTAQNIWYSILSEAQKHEDGITKVIDAALVDYKEHKLLLAAKQRLLGE
jgi:hypothetical protein